MTAIAVDRTLIFRFSEDWAARHWDAPTEQRGSPRKKVDVVAAGPFALLVEAKDDRIKDAASLGRRKKAVRTGEFCEDIAIKFRHSTEDICAKAALPGSEPFYRAFVAEWDEGRRQLVLWWELPPSPPSGEGTLDERWKAHLSARQNTLKQRLRDLSPRVRIANQRFHPNVVTGMTVADIADGIGYRRETVRPR